MEWGLNVLLGVEIKLRKETNESKKVCIEGSTAKSWKQKRATERAKMRQPKCERESKELTKSKWRGWGQSERLSEMSVRVCAQ